MDTRDRNTDPGAQEAMLPNASLLSDPLLTDMTQGTIPSLSEQTATTPDQPNKKSPTPLQESLGRLRRAAGPSERFGGLCGRLDVRFAMGVKGGCGREHDEQSNNVRKPHADRRVQTHALHRRPLSGMTCEQCGYRVEQRMFRPKRIGAGLHRPMRNLHTLREIGVADDVGGEPRHWLGAAGYFVGN